MINLEKKYNFRNAKTTLQIYYVGTIIEQSGRGWKYAVGLSAIATSILKRLSRSFELGGSE